MARYVRSHQQMQIYKTTTEPTVAANGLKVGDLWIDTTTDADVKVCTAVGPVVFEEVGGGGGGGSGDVVGPASATDNAVARFDSTTGKLIQNSSGVTISDADVLTVDGVNIGSGGTSTDTFVGLDALDSHSSGTDCTAVGHNAAKSLSIGDGATAVGAGAMGMSITGADVTAIGRDAGGQMTGSNNTSVGSGAMKGGLFASGAGNTAMGKGSLDLITTGANNVAVGMDSGNIITTGGNNTFIGEGSDGSSSSAEDCIAIGANAIATKHDGSGAAHNGPGIAIGSSTEKVGFRGNGTIYPGKFGRVKWNGTHYMLPLQTDGATEIDLVGTSTNDNAAAGSVGELLTATASTVALTTVTTKNITSVSLTAGDWDVWGVIAFDKAAGTTVTQTVSWTSETSATLPAVLLRSESTHSATNPLAAGTRRFSLQPPVVRYSLSGTTTIYLSTYQDFSGSTLTVSGTIYARRRR